MGYTALKLIGFITAPWLLNRIGAQRLLVALTLLLALSCGVAALTTELPLLTLLRMVQGFAGGVVLVGGQMLLFLAYPRAQQPLLQALFAMGSVVAPATLVPALQGWLVDTHSWTWIFFSMVPVALAAAGLLLLANYPRRQPRAVQPFDWLGLVLLASALLCFTYVLSQGSRWDWFEARHMVWLTVCGAASMLAFLGQQVLTPHSTLFNLSLFRSADFAFAFLVSFVAGAALFGSAYLIPTFAVAVLNFTPTDAGLLLLPSAALFVGALLLAAYLMQVRRAPPIATVPFGIALIMASMWMLAGSTRDSGATDMMAAILLRGLGLGFLFLSITLIAFGKLRRAKLASGIGLFNAGRQLGGLLGVAALQTLIQHGLVANVTALGTHIATGTPAVIDRLNATTALLAAKGMDPAAASKAATNLLAQTVTGQANVIAFDTAFNAIALLFVFAAPALVAIKIGLARYAKVRAKRANPTDITAVMSP